MSKFEELSQIDVSAYTEKKNGLTYLSWAQAWREFKTHCPDATYEVKHFDGKPYAEDKNLGYLVETVVTVGEESHSMWLPVLDFRNKAIKVGDATMFDVNTALMRCLTKNLAMFGLGIYIYAGEDLPIQPPEKPSDVIDSINGATMTLELQTIWENLSPELKKRPDVLKAKNEKKKELSQ